jgi:hypothetical protein
MSQGSTQRPVVLYDANGNPAGVILDGGVYRLQTEAKLTDGTTAAVIDPNHSALVGIDHVHYKIHSGLYYNVKNWASVSGSGTQFNLLLKVPAAKLPHLVYAILAGDIFDYTLYEGTTVSADGAAQSVFNSNRNSANASGVTVFTGPTVTATGTAIQAGQLLGGTKGNAAVDREAELILKPSTNYLLRFIKGAAGAAFVDYDLKWYENV